MEFTRTFTTESDEIEPPAGMSRAAAYTSTVFRSGLAYTNSAALTLPPNPSASSAVAQRLMTARPYGFSFAVTTQLVKKLPV